MNERLEQQDHAEWVTKIQEYKEKYPLVYHKDVLSGPFVVEEIYRQTKGEAIISTEVGQHQMWAAQFYKYTKPRTFLTSGGLGTMGYGLGAALGAKSGRDFVKLAEAMGAEGIRATTQEEFKSAFEKAMNLGRPVVIDCQIDSDDKVWPMVAPGAEISEAFDEADLKNK